MSAAAPPGSGEWSFDNVGIPGGRRSEVRIVVTDPSGNKTVSRQNLLASPMLEPRGRLSYTAGIGTNRNRLSISETSGLLAGARATLGLSDRLTVGLAASFSGGFYDRLVSGITAQRRVYPKNSSSISGEFAWSPADTVLLSGTTAYNVNVGKDDSVGSGAWAALVDCDVFAGKSTLISGRLFHYGRSFFNGTNPSLTDRSGFALNTSHEMGSMTMTAAVGTVSGSISASSYDKVRIGFQKMAIGARFGRTSMLKAQVDRVDPGAGRSANVIASVALSTEVARAARLEMFASAGSPLVTGFDGELLEGLSLPLNLYESPRKAVGLSTSLGPRQSLSVQYLDNAAYRRVTLVHNLLPNSGRSLFSRLALRTELGRDLTSGMPYAEGRIEYRPSALSQSSMSVRGRYHNGEWRAMFSANTTELFGFFQRQPKRVTNSGVDPQNGAINGVVFLDFDGNGMQERGEPGMSDIKVLTNNRRSSVAGRSGYFILPVRSRTKEERVYLDVASVPANYSLSNGIQTARIAPGSITRVSLGITPLHAIAGKVVISNESGGKNPLAGVRVFATKAGNGVKLPDSVTAGDGTFYIGDVKPGEYDIHIDAKTIPEGCALPAEQNRVVVAAAKDSQEINLGEIALSPAH